MASEEIMMKLVNTLLMLNVILITCNAQQSGTGVSCNNVLCAVEAPLCLNLEAECTGLPCTLQPTCVPRNAKPGSCPPNRRGDKSNCVTSCQEDVDCLRTKKCCDSGCSRYCSQPVRKSGRCPVRGILSLRNCILQCTQDADCAEDLKCCSNGCGRFCSKPRQTSSTSSTTITTASTPQVTTDGPSSRRSTTVSPTSPRSTTVSPTSPRSTTDIQTTTKSITGTRSTRRITRKTTTTETAGTPFNVCPDFGDSTSTVCDRACAADSDCFGAMLCCPEGCSTICQDPVVDTVFGRPIRCPLAASDICLDKPIAFCYVGTSCKADETCCRARCGPVCVNNEVFVPTIPSTETTSLQTASTTSTSTTSATTPTTTIGPTLPDVQVCPPIGRAPTDVCTIKCNTDADCKKNKICCPQGCGTVCRLSLPVNTPGPLGRCPANRGDLCLDQSNNQRCEVDGDCLSGSSCCRSRCGAICIPAAVAVTTTTPTTRAQKSTSAAPVEPLPPCPSFQCFSPSTTCSNLPNSPTICPSPFSCCIGSCGEPTCGRPGAVTAPTATATVATTRRRPRRCPRRANSVCDQGEFQTCRFRRQCPPGNICCTTTTCGPVCFDPSPVTTATTTTTTTTPATQPAFTVPDIVNVTEPACPLSPCTVFGLNCLTARTRGLCQLPRVCCVGSCGISTCGNPDLTSTVPPSSSVPAATTTKSPAPLPAVITPDTVLLPGK